jgi:methanogenic corrinoid protein MtbC1
MTAINDFSDEPRYTIKSVSVQTGIRPVTLRAWERRHELLNPYRSDNRYRLYSERDIAILRWIKSRVDEGISISNAVLELRQMTRNGVWPDAVPTAPTRTLVTPKATPETYTHWLYEALIKHNEERAAELVKELQSSYDLMTIFSRVVAPTLVAIGEAWYRGEIRITTEHYASNFLRARLMSLLQAYPTRRNAPYIQLGCAPTEQHELGSLMMAVLLRSEGFRVEYLGPDLPIDDLVDYASYEFPDMIVLSASTELAAFEMRRLKEKLDQIDPAPQVAYGGSAFDNNPKVIEMVPGNYIGRTFEEGLETIKELLKVKELA